MQYNYVDHRISNSKRSNIDVDKFTNFIKVSNEEDQYGKINIEIQFKKNGRIMIRNINIFRENLKLILDKFKNAKFNVYQSGFNSTDNYQNITPQLINSKHPEYIKNTGNFLRDAYDTSFSEKFKKK